MCTNEYLASADLLSLAKEKLAMDDFSGLNDIDIEICALLQSKQKSQSFEALTDEQQICVATFNVESYVNSGGFMDLFQYFSDEELHATNRGYEAFRATSLLKLIEKAIKKFPKSPPLPSQSKREEILDSWFDKDKDPFEKLDSKFQDIGSALKGRIEYIINHPDQFFIN